MNERHRIEASYSDVYRGEPLGNQDIHVGC